MIVLATLLPAALGKPGIAAFHHGDQAQPARQGGQQRPTGERRPEHDKGFSAGVNLSTLKDMKPRHGGLAGDAERFARAWVAINVDPVHWPTGPEALIVGDLASAERTAAIVEDAQ